MDSSSHCVRTLLSHFCLPARSRSAWLGPALPKWQLTRSLQRATLGLAAGTPVPWDRANPLRPWSEFLTKVSENKALPAVYPCTDQKNPCSPFTNHHLVVLALSEDCSPLSALLSSRAPLEGKSCWQGAELSTGAMLCAGTSTALMAPLGSRPSPPTDPQDPPEPHPCQPGRGSR